MSNTLFHLEDNILEKVAETFNKTKETLNEEVKEIRKWLETQHHLPELMDERMVRNFYLLNKCRMEKTKQKIDNYYTARSQSKDIFDTSNPKLPNMKFFMEAVYFMTLPKLTEDMYRVSVYKVRDPSKINDVNPYDIIRHYTNTMEVRLHEDITYGDVCIVDASNLTMKFLLKISPLFIYKILVVVYERVYSSRLKAVYMYNCPAFLENVMKLMKKIIKPKLFSRFYMYQDQNSVFEKFSKDILPKDFGGSEKSLEELQEIWKNKFEEYQDRFDQLDQLKVDENLRPKDKKTASIFGIW